MSSNLLGYLSTLEDASSGVSSFTQAGIAAAIATLPASGGAVQLPAGRFTFSAALVVNKPNVSLVGASESATTIAFTYNGVAIDVQAASVELSDLTIIGPDAIASPLSTAIKVRAASCRAVQCQVFGCAVAIDHHGAKGQYDAIQHVPSGAIKPGTLLLMPNGVAGDTGVYMQNCTSEFAVAPAFDVRHATLASTLLSCRTLSHSLGAPSPTPAFKVGGSEGEINRLSLVGCEATSGGSQSEGLLIAPTGTQIVGTLRVSGCGLSGATRGIDANLANLTSAVMINDNIITGTATNNAMRIQNVTNTSGGLVLNGNKTTAACALGVSLVNVPRCAVSGNTFYAAAGSGLIMTLTAAPLVLGNVIRTSIDEPGATNSAQVGFASNQFA